MIRAFIFFFDAVQIGGRSAVIGRFFNFLFDVFIYIVAQIVINKLRKLPVVTHKNYPFYRKAHRNKEIGRCGACGFVYYYRVIFAVRCVLLRNGFFLFQNVFSYRLLACGGIHKITLFYSLGKSSRSGLKIFYPVCDYLLLFVQFAVYLFQRFNDFGAKRCHIFARRGTPSAWPRKRRVRRRRRRPRRRCPSANRRRPWRT